MQTGPLTFLFLLVVVLSFGCRRDELIPEPLAVEMRDTANAFDIIRVGDPVNMSVDTGNIELNPGVNAMVIRSLDLNGDGIMDLQFYAARGQSPGSGVWSRTSMSCLHENVQFRIAYGPDTTFIHEDTMGLDIHRTYSCTRIDGTDFISNVNTARLKLIVMDSLDLLSRMDEFSADSLGLSSTPYFSPIPSYEAPYRIYSMTAGNCGRFPIGQLKYVGILINDSSSETRLGWIKMRIAQGYMLIAEWAIQE